MTYALQDSAKHDDDPGAGRGFVSAFDTQGNFLGRVASMGTLNSPWGLSIAPTSFTGFAGDLLVGNFGDGTINVFNPDPVTPGFLGQLSGTDGKPIVIDGPSAFCSPFSPFPSRVRWLWSWPRWCCWLGGGRGRTAGAQLPREDRVLSGPAVSGVSSKARQLQLIPRWDGARSHDSDLPVLRHDSVQAVQEPWP